MVVGGHQRLLAARKLGLKQVPVVLVDLPEEQAHLLNLALNKISGTWDQELLARLLGELKDLPDVDITLTGFSEDELQKHLKSLESREKREAFRDIPTWMKQWKPHGRHPLWLVQAIYGC